MIRPVCGVSFKKVIPINSVIIGQDVPLCVDNKGQGYFSFEKKTISTNEPDIVKKALQELNRILTRYYEEDKIIPVYEKIREKFKKTVSDYDIPGEKIDNKKEKLVKPLYSKDGMTYLLTGEQAQKYADAGKNIGKAKQAQKIGAPSQPSVGSRKRDFALTSNGILYGNANNRIKDARGRIQGLVIYAQSSCKKMDITDIDFKPVFKLAEPAF